MGLAQVSPSPPTNCGAFFPKRADRGSCATNSPISARSTSCSEDCVGKLFAGMADLLGAEPEMVAPGEHLLEGQVDFAQAAGAVWARASTCSCRCRPCGPFRRLDSSIRRMVNLEGHFRTSYGRACSDRARWRTSSTYGQWCRSHQSGRKGHEKSHEVRCCRHRFLRGVRECRCSWRRDHHVGRDFCIRARPALDRQRQRRRLPRGPPSRLPARAALLPGRDPWPAPRWPG